MPNCNPTTSQCETVLSGISAYNPGIEPSTNAVPVDNQIFIIRGNSPPQSCVGCPGDYVWVVNPGHPSVPDSSSISIYKKSEDGSTWTIEASIAQASAVGECQFFETTAALCGFSEFASPSTPPKKYLKKTKSGSMVICNYPQSDCTLPSPNSWSGGGRLSNNNGSYSGILRPIGVREDGAVLYSCSVSIFMDAQTHHFFYDDGIHTLDFTASRPSPTVISVHYSTGFVGICPGPGLRTVSWRTETLGPPPQIHTKLFDYCGGGTDDGSDVYPGASAQNLDWSVGFANDHDIASGHFDPIPSVDIRLVSPAGSAFDEIVGDGGSVYLDPSHGPYTIIIRLNGSNDTNTGVLLHPAILSSFLDEFNKETEYSIDTCGVTSTDLSTRSFSYPLECGGESVWVPEGSPPSEYDPSYVDQTISRIEILLQGNEQCVNADSKSSNYSGIVTESLDLEDTEDNAINRSLSEAVWSDSGTCTGFSSFRNDRAPDSFEFVFRSQRTRANCSNLVVGSSYRATLHFGKRPNGSSDPWVDDGELPIVFTATDVTYISDWINVDIPSPEFERSVTGVSIVGL